MIRTRNHLLAIAVMLSLTTTLTAQALRFSPERPKPGETLNLTYNPAGTPLAESKNLNVAGYAFNGFEVEVIEVTWKEKNGQYEGQVAIPATAKAFFVAVADKDTRKPDDNGGKGYGTMLYQADRSTPVAGAQASMGFAIAANYYLINAQRDDKLAFNLLRQDFATVKANENLLSVYANMATRNKDAEAISQVKTIINELSNKPKATEDEWMRAYFLSQNIQDKALAESIAIKLRKKYPKGQIFWREKQDAFYQTEDLAVKTQIFNELQAAPKIKNSEQMLGSFASSLAYGYNEKGDAAATDKYAALVTDKMSKASLFNSIAWSLSGESLDGEAGDLQRAKKLSWESLQLMQALIDQPNPEGKPKNYTLEQWRDILKSNYVMFADTYALIAYRLGNSDEALRYQQVAVDQNKFTNPEMNERYCIFLEKVKGSEKAQTLLEDLIAKGHASPKMKEQFKRLFAANNTPESAAGKYINLLEKEARLKIKEELKKKMIDEEAPAFTLKNLKGETVSLSSLAGKVVVVDFWATWCGPCKASFPGMQRAQDAHKDRDDVVFLFVDTWENGNDKEKNATDFIEKNNYTFNVLMDNDNAVVTKFKVEGIPTKFILDRNGRIRFKSVGYGGNEDALVDEMSFMVELAGQSGSKEMKGSE